MRTCAYMDVRKKWRGNFGLRVSWYRVVLAYLRHAECRPIIHHRAALREHVPASVGGACFRVGDGLHLVQELLFHRQCVQRLANRGGSAFLPDKPSYGGRAEALIPSVERTSLPPRMRFVRPVILPLCGNPDDRLEPKGNASAVEELAPALEQMGASTGPSGSQQAKSDQKP